MISIKNVSFSYQGNSVEKNNISNINIEIQSGECVLLCGRSGCGKTTITRLINGLIPHFFPGTFSGAVYIEGTPISEIPMYKLAEKVGSVFQNPRTQFFNIDTDSEIAFGIENSAYKNDELKKRVDKTVKDLGIKNLLNRNIFDLSGGEKQKIAFASAYAMMPEVYVLDEPSSNLDADAIEDLRKHLDFIKKQGKTIIIADHRFYFLKEIVDTVIYMDDGKITNTYTSEDFFNLSKEQRNNMGLRATNLKEISYKEKRLPTNKDKIEVNNLSLGYRKNTILNGINLTASYGEIIGIIGHNGAGKTTFSRGLCGLHKECGGSIFFSSNKVNNKSRLKNSYMVMQDVNYQLFAESVKEECSFGIKNPDYELVDKTMKALEIYKYKDFHPNLLSGGQKQRTAIATSMICHKNILIFDEPTSGLDYDSMQQTSQLIETLAHQGKIIFVVTHDFEFICETCQRILHFDNGKLEEDYLVNRKNFKRLQTFFIEK